MNVLPLTADHPLPDGRVQLFGAVRTVTGSITRIETGGRALLVDCGIAQGHEAVSFSVPDAAFDVDAVLLTHGHLDHVGSLPALLDSGRDVPILGTAATLSVTDIVVSDSIRLSGASAGDVSCFRSRLRRLARTVRYDEAASLPGFQGTVAFREAGHILGSASVEIVTPRSRIICSGDLGRPGSPLLRDYCETWRSGRPVDLVLLESTYGDRLHCHGHDDIEHELERIIHRAVDRRGPVLIPAFAVGRTQTLLYYLDVLRQTRRIPVVPVAVDTPMGLVVTELYQHSRDLFDEETLTRLAHGDDPLDFPNLFAVRRACDSRRLDEIREAIVIIAGSGMCTGGRVVGHLRDLLPREDATILFSGFQAPGTTGARIQAIRNRDTVVEIEGESVPVRATIETLSGLSAHADRRELCRWLHAIPGVKRIGLNHGEPEAQRELARTAMAKAPFEEHVHV